MPRIARVAPGGLVHHVLNRANGRLRLFKKEDDFLAFEEVLALAHERLPIRILDWVMMSNHWSRRAGSPLATARRRLDPQVLERVQLSLKRGRPYGTQRWTEKTAKRLGLESTLHDPWRPKKKKARKGKRTRRTT